MPKQVGCVETYSDSELILRRSYFMEIKSINFKTNSLYPFCNVDSWFLFPEHALVDGLAFWVSFPRFDNANENLNCFVQKKCNQLID